MPTPNRYRVRRGDHCGYNDPHVYVVQKFYAGLGVWCDIGGPVPLGVAQGRVELLNRGVLVP